MKRMRLVDEIDFEKVHKSNNKDSQFLGADSHESLFSSLPNELKLKLHDILARYNRKIEKDAEEKPIYVKFEKSEQELQDKDKD